jgi:hypothetical protein
MQRGPGYGERGPGVPEILGWAIAGPFCLGIIHYRSKKSHGVYSLWAIPSSPSKSAWLK